MAAQILIVGDHPLVREGLREIVARELDLVVCGVAANGASALAAIPILSPDVVVLDLALRSDDGVSFLSTLHEQHPLLRILVLSMHDERFYAEKLLALGAHGYVMKNEPAAVLLVALRQVAVGREYITPALASRLATQLCGPRRPRTSANQLTHREHDVLRALARGFGTQQIAALLNMSAKTVDSHRRNMRDKLGLQSAGELVRYGMQWEAPSAAPPVEA